MVIKTQKFRIQGFTIIELLAVVVISSMLMVVALPAFTTMINGSSVAMAARQVKGELSAARSYAISKRKYVAVLMPSADFPEIDSNFAVNDKYMNCSMRACIVTGSGYSWKFDRWISGESWQFLPDNVAIFQAINSDVINLNDSANFNPDSGRVEVTIPYKDFSEDGNSTVEKPILAVVFKPTGRTAGCKVKIGEGKFSGSAVTVTNTNACMTVSTDSNSGKVAIEP